MLEDLLELHGGGCQGPGVIDGVAAGGAFLIEGPLGEFTAAKFFGRPTPGAGGTLPAEICGGVDKNEQIAEWGESGFEQQCRVEDDGVDVRWDILELMQDFGADPRPNDLVKRFAGGLLRGAVAKDECGEGGAVDFAVGIENLGAELSDQGGTDCWRAELLVADAVGIDDLQSES